MSKDYMCAVWCNACSTGDHEACAGVMNEPQCRRSCPAWLRNMGNLYAPSGDPDNFTVSSSVNKFVTQFKKDQSQNESEGESEDGSRGESKDVGSTRDTKMMTSARTRGTGRETMIPTFMNRGDVWGGGLRRMVEYGTAPRREDEHYYAPRYVPIGFARYVSPVVNPMDYKFYRLSGWRIAVPRKMCDAKVRGLLMRIYRYGPQSAGYARLGDTLVPAILSPGDRKTLSGLDTRY